MLITIQNGNIFEGVTIKFFAAIKRFIVHTHVPRKTKTPLKFATRWSMVNSEIFVWKLQNKKEYFHLPFQSYKLTTMVNSSLKG